MRLYWEVAIRGYRRFATYRAATIAGVFTNTAFGFMRAYVLIAVFAGAATIGGYDESDALTYVFVGQGMLMTIYLWSWWEIALTVQSGDIATDLSRPFDYQLYWLSQDLGRAAYHLVFRGIPPFILGALVFQLKVPLSPWTWAAFLASIVLAVCVSFAFRFMSNLAAFWTVDYRGASVIQAGILTFLSGFAVPVALFPSTLKAIAEWLPFVAMLQLPADIFLGKYDGADLLLVLARQLGWALLLLGAGRLVLRAAMRKLVIQGG